MKQPLILYLLISLSCVTFAQKPTQKNSIKKNIYSLRVGDLVPDILIPKIINDERDSVTTNQFKNQLLILDFWATTCSACIEGLPKMMDLQKQFGTKIKILPVTSEPEELIRSFMQRNKLIKNLKTPSIVEDKILSTWFKHRIQPHEVWIYKNKVVAITGGEYVDATNIQIVLDGKELNLPIKDDFYKYDYDSTFLSIRSKKWNNDQYPLKYITLTGYHEGAVSRMDLGVDSSKKINRVYFLNFPILKAYFMLWKNIKQIDYVSSPGSINAGGISPNQVRLEVKNRDKYIFNPGKDYWESWNRKNDISYEWVSSHNNLSIKEKSTFIINDLDRLLNLKGRWEKRDIRCLILVRSSSEDKIRSKGGEHLLNYETQVKQIKNQSLSDLIFYLNNFADNPPFFDGTDYKYNVDLDLRFSSWTDLKSIKEALNMYGLDLKEETRNIDIFVLTENSEVISR